jgi:membrane protease YdiL (CAAX protease family)
VNSLPKTSDDRFAAELRSFRPAGIIAILVIILTGNIVLPNMVTLPIGAVLVLIWVRLSHTPWQDIGYVKPKSWIITLFVGFIFGIAFKLIMKVIVMPLLGADPINHSYHFLAENRAMLPAAVWAMLVAGFAEETVFRGFMFERLGKLLGSGITSKTLIVLITSILFALGHYYNQGVTGVEQASITGLVFGIIFAATGNIWFIMIAHAAFDLTALAIIYWNLETEIAHLVFR